MSSTRKITYTAVGAAVAAVCLFLTNFGWLKISLLMAAALCYYIVCCKCGFGYGVADVAVSLLLVFFTGGLTPLSSAFLLTAIVFAPYALLSYFIRKLYYTKWQTALIRLGAVAVFANLALVGVWFAAKWIAVDVLTIAGRLGGYAVLALLFTVFALVFDLLFNQLSIRLLKLLK
ncbi:MAG: hypothetical protein K2M95_06005 [Clostridiales bacterium]|nr:hypothetical protein [Clostridiales bacterium]